MKHVNELIKNISNSIESIDGYLVYLSDGGLYLIDIDYGDAYQAAPSILIKITGFLIIWSIM